MMKGTHHTKTSRLKIRDAKLKNPGLLYKRGVCIPARVEDDGTSVVLSNGTRWCCVESVEGNRLHYRSKYFIREEKITSKHRVILVGDGFGVMENTLGHFPVRCKLGSLLRLIENRSKKLKENANEF